MCCVFCRDVLPTTNDIYLVHSVLPTQRLVAVSRPMIHHWHYTVNVFIRLILSELSSKYDIAAKNTLIMEVTMRQLCTVFIATYLLHRVHSTFKVSNYQIQALCKDLHW